MAAVTIDGKTIGRLTQEFATLQDALLYGASWCQQRRRSIDVTLTIGAVPEWGLASGGTYQLTIAYDSTDGECGWSFVLVSEG